MLKDEGFRLNGVLRTDERTNERTFVIVELLSRLISAETRIGLKRIFYFNCPYLPDNEYRGGLNDEINDGQSRRSLSRSPSTSPA